MANISISGIEHSSVILSQNKYCKKVKYEIEKVRVKGSALLLDHFVK